MMFEFSEVNPVNGRKAIAIISQSDDEDRLILELHKAFHKGRVLIEAQDKAGKMQARGFVAVP